MICTAAGREGINLQHARVLFNFDLPWNPMDLEQRIGRIHRYGQRHTAQVYNLVLSDTIEGSIFLLLDEKLTEIGRALGKVDERGQIAEDLRTQILGQLSMQVNYASLYSEALNDPELKRTKVELDSAMSNAVEARKVVFELFQELDGFRLDDYKAMGNPEEGAGVLARFLADAASAEGETFNGRGEHLFAWFDKDSQTETLLTTHANCRCRKRASSSSASTIRSWRHAYAVSATCRLTKSVYGSSRQTAPRSTGDVGGRGPWRQGTTEARRHSAGRGHRRQAPRHVGAPAGEALSGTARSLNGTHADQNLALLRDTLEPMLQRELEHRGVVTGSRGFEAKLIGWVEGIIS